MNLLRDITIFINNLFVVYIFIYSFLLFLSIVIGALTLNSWEKRRKYKTDIINDYNVGVSILVPAFNEEVTIIDTVDSLINLDYKGHEIIVIDDGSTDNTVNKVIDKYNLVETNMSVIKKFNTKKVLGYYEAIVNGVNVVLIIKENGGKADSLNAGINICRNDYFITIDADSILKKDALINITKPIIFDNNVVAIGGLIRISIGMTIVDGSVVDYKFPKEMAVIIQNLEYDRTFLASRILFDAFNGNLIISGAFGLFKKDIVLAVGGYSTNTVGEDMELVTRMHEYCLNNRIKYSIKYVPDAICYTQVPTMVKDLKKQRQRWHIGLFQSLIMHKNMFLNIKYGVVGCFSFLYYWVYELVSPITEIVGFIFIFISAFLNLINFRFMLMYSFVYILFCTFFSAVAFFTRTYTMVNRITFGDSIKIILYSFIENFGFRQLINFYRFMAFVNYKSNKNKWGKITRVKNS